MAFPWAYEENFELGTLGNFDTESDDDSRLDYPHYSELWRTPGLAMPWRGAYCMRVALANASNPAYVQETGSFDMTAGTNDIYVRFQLFISPSLVMATTNEFGVMQFWSATNTVEAGVYVNYTTANGYRIGIGEGSASSFLPLTLGEWHTVEVFFDPAGSNNSTIDLWVDGASATQVASFTSADITSAVFGVVGQDAGTTAGTVLFDQIMADEARLYVPAARFPENVVISKTGHLFVGGGVIDNVTLVSGGAADNVLTIYDTDQQYDEDEHNIVVGPIKNTAANETVDTAGLPALVRRGAYIKLSGTNPRANVQIGRALGYGSDGAIRAVAANRGGRPFA